MDNRNLRLVLKREVIHERQINKRVTKSLKEILECGHTRVRWCSEHRAVHRQCQKCSLGMPVEVEGDELEELKARVKNAAI